MVNVLCIEEDRVIGIIEGIIDPSRHFVSRCFSFNIQQLGFILHLLGQFHLL